MTDEFRPGVVCRGAVRLPPGIGFGPGNSGARRWGVRGTSHLHIFFSVIWNAFFFWLKLKCRQTLGQKLVFPGGCKTFVDDVLRADSGLHVSGTLRISIVCVWSTRVHRDWCHYDWDNEAMHMGRCSGTIYWIQRPLILDKQKMQTFNKINFKILLLIFNNV